MKWKYMRARLRFQSINTNYMILSEFGMFSVLNDTSRDWLWWTKEFQWFPGLEDQKSEFCSDWVFSVFWCCSVFLKLDDWNFHEWLPDRAWNTKAPELVKIWWIHGLLYSTKNRTECLLPNGFIDPRTNAAIKAQKNDRPNVFNGK